MVKKYIWWKTPLEALDFPDRVIAQVMDIGDFDDIILITNHLGEETLHQVLTQAQAGWLRPKSWYFWHYRLGLCDEEDLVPPMPQRNLV